MKPKKKKKQKIKITPASIVGILIGLIIVITGFYTVAAYGGYGGYYAVALGICFIILILVIMWSTSR